MSENPLSYTPQPGSVPVPDPTALTTEQVDKAKIELTRLFDEQLHGLSKEIGVKFDWIADQLSTIERHRIEQKVDTKTAVDAAFAASKEASAQQAASSEKAIAKTELAAIEQSKQQQTTFAAELKGIIGQVSDIKDRLITIEALKLGSIQQKTSAHDDQRAITTMIAVSISVMGLLLSAVVLAVNIIVK